MKKTSVFKPDRTFLLATLAIAAALPHILLHGGKLLFPLLGLAALLLLWNITARLTAAPEDPTQKDREAAVNKLLSSPFYILRGGHGGGAPATPTAYSLTPRMRYGLWAWLIVAVVHLFSAIVIEEANGGGFAKFYPLWIILFVIAVIDLAILFRQDGKA